MTLFDRIRAIALALPDTTEQDDADFLVAGEAFVRIEGDPPVLHLREGDGWTTMALAGEPDWTLIEDGIARSWELAAPAGLLEAGGR